MQQPRHETYTLRNGTGRLQLRGKQVFGLFFDDRPIVFHWYDCEGSIGQEIYHFAARDAGIDSPDLRKIVEQFPPDYLPLAIILEPLLSQFPSGNVDLELLSTPTAGDYLEWEEKGRRNGFYPYDTRVLVATQPLESIDPDRVLYFMDRIEDGGTPWAITVAADDCEYVLDGHHKLLAYFELKRDPWRLVLSPPIERSLRLEDWPLTVPISGIWRQNIEWEQQKR